MSSASSNDLVTFSPRTRTAFLQYLRENPNNRRVSHADKEIILEWLTNPAKRPSSQKEFSRRNYVRKTFAWDEKTQIRLAVGKIDETKDRMVITEDMIADVVESVHWENSHAGWDATWRALSTSYYGILRSDLIFLLQQCPICAQNPSKRPKGFATATLNTELVDQEILEFPNMGDIQKQNPAWVVADHEQDQGHTLAETSSEYLG